MDRLARWGRLDFWACRFGLRKGGGGLGNPEFNTGLESRRDGAVVWPLHLTGQWSVLGGSGDLVSR